jgi:hypothetical protein
LFLEVTLNGIDVDNISNLVVAVLELLIVTDELTVSFVIALIGERVVVEGDCVDFGSIFSDSCDAIEVKIFVVLLTLVAL